MAKWGEGDPRWIVEERPDATNVNNWHWTEKNASDWSKEKLELLFKDLTFQDLSLGKIRIEEVSKCEGEATANNRKGKLIFFYEWNVELEWKAKPAVSGADSGKAKPAVSGADSGKAKPAVSGADSEEIDGKIHIVNLSEENDYSEIEIDVTLSKNSPLGERFKDFIRLKGIHHIRDKVKCYIQALREEYALDLILPTKGQQQAPTKESKTSISHDLANNIKNITVSCPKEKKVGSLEFNTTTIHLSQSFKCTADELYRVFIVKEMVCAFTRNDVKWNPEVGGTFELFGGNVTGEFVELIPKEKIVQKWRFKSWPPNHHSEVILSFSQGEDSTRLDLRQSGVPVSDIERTKQGWQNYYWDAIKRTFGFGALLS